ncbi:MAG: HAMP domain-containing histidine kinase, partial [Cytophagaceae bacterium]
MTQAESAAFIRRLRFPPEIERVFQESYFARMHSAVQISILISVVLSALSGVALAKTEVAFDFTRPTVLLFFAIAGMHVLLLGATLRREFVGYWQLSVVVSTLILLGAQLATSSSSLIPYVVVALIVIVCRLQRLQFRWMTFLLFSLLILSIVSEIVDPTGGYTGQRVVVASIIGVILLATPFFWTLKSERFDRREFLAKYLLAQERNEEREKREQTEKMLHILSQAIGGIVHDLGNPLTAVQGGAETLQSFLQETEPDKEMMKEFTEMITDGALMLNYLRLSLMEQTRVLEGKPVPVELKSTSIRHIVEAGTHYQKPRFAAGRRIVLHGEEMEVCVDEMRFITVLMNLIGNALKYS